MFCVFINLVLLHDEEDEENEEEQNEQDAPPPKKTRVTGVAMFWGWILGRQ